MSPHLFVATGIFHPEPGGPATYLYALLPALQARGWDVSLLTYGDDPVAGYSFPVRRVSRRVLPLRLMQYAQMARPRLSAADLVYAHTIDLPLYGSRAAPRIIKIVGDQAWERCIRKGWIAPDTDVDDFQTMPAGPVVARQRQSRANQVRAMDGVIVPSRYLKQMVIGWGVAPERIHVIYNALPPLPDTLPSSQVAARRNLPDLFPVDESPVLLTAARLEAWKGVDHLITAVLALPDVRLIVAGDGPDRERLERLAMGSSRITFTGRVPRERLYTMMCAADYFALYSGYEGLPHSLLESLRTGTPVIASDKGGNPEVVQPGVNGFLVPYVDVEALMETIRQALEPGVRERLAAGTGTGMSRFGFERMVEQTDSVLRGYL